MKQLVTLACGALVVGGVAYWLGRSSHDTAEAQPARVVETAAPVVPAPAPRRATVPAPVLARPRPVPGLHADLVAEDPRVRRAAVLEVARGSDPDPQVMLTASRDRDLDVSATAMASLGKLYAAGQVSTSDMIERATDRGINERVRMTALDGLGVVENPDAAKLLVRMLETGTALERRSAAALLANQDAELAIPALIRALSDGDEYVRGNAHESLTLRSRGRDFGTDAGSWQAWWQSRR